jgi:hypothetical protein
VAMTDSIPLDSLPTPGDNARRDQWGRYMIVPPGGGNPVAYTRVTTIAKTLDSFGGLAPWKASMTAAGIIMRRGLRAQWEALLAAHGDPWYAGEEAKAQCKRLVEDCAAVGGANDRREVGSSLHTLTALLDLGRPPSHLTEETERDLRAYADGLAIHNITIVPGQVELQVVLDSYQVAGTFDRLAVVPGFDLPLVADLKTGANLEYSWQSIAVQLAAYSRGEALYRQGPAKDGSADQRLSMPAVDQDWGLVFWLNAGEAQFELYLVDLNAGWEAFGHSMWARGWHDANPQRPLDQPVPTNPDNLLAQLEASVAIEQAKHRHPTEATMHDQAIEDNGLRAWLQQRIDQIGQHAQARTALARAWPSDIPTLRASTTHTPDQLDDVELLLNDVERRYELSFPPPKPGSEVSEEQATARVLNLFPDSTVTTDNRPKEPA